MVELRGVGELKSSLEWRESLQGRMSIILERLGVAGSLISRELIAIRSWKLTMGTPPDGWSYARLSSHRT